MRRPLLSFVSVLLAVGLVAAACGSSDGSEETASGPSSSTTTTDAGGGAAGGGGAGAGSGAGAGPAAGPGRASPSTMPRRTTTTTVARPKAAPKPKARPGAPAGPRTTTTMAPRPAPTTTTTAPRPAPTLPPKPVAFCDHLGRLASFDPTSLPGYTVGAVDTVLGELNALRAGAPPVTQPWLDALIAPLQLLRTEIEAGRVTDEASALAWAYRVGAEQPQLAKDLKAAKFSLSAYYAKRCQG